jgi:hypothetical protein
MNTYRSEVRPAPSSFQKILLSLWHAACVSRWHGACAVPLAGPSGLILYAGGFARLALVVGKLQKGATNFSLLRNMKRQIGIGSLG